ncbi:MAG: ADP-ribosylglycohydrolase family protein [Verrucomicrobiota bacterium]
MPTAHDLVLSSLLGDALALGTHWVYDQEKIVRERAPVEGFSDPLSDYHPGKQAGDFTHYGDQVALLLKSVRAEGRFALETYAAEWRAFWEHPGTQTYRDGATKATLAHLQGGGSPHTPGSDSHDFSGAVRSGPLFLLEWPDDTALEAAARELASFTHGDPAVIEASTFLVRVTRAVQGGAPIPTAVRSAAEQSDGRHLPPEWLGAAEESAQSARRDAEAIKALGLPCGVESALPATLHLLLRYPEEPAVALQRNAEAGGDNAARGLALGLVYGARFGVSAYPANWVDDLRLERA